jgi:AcrR family transcriptional regulator
MGTREDILEAANAVYSERGYDGLSMRAIGAKIGLSPMAIYRHFKDKDELLHHVALHGLSLWKERLLACACVADPVERIIEAGRAYVSFADEHRPHFDVTFLATDRLGHLKYQTEGGARAFDEVFALYAQWVAQCLGISRSDCELKDHAIDIWAYSHGLLVLHLAGRLEFLKVDFSEYHARKLRAYVSLKRSGMK